MDEKTRAIADLRDVFDQWKALAARLREPELTAPLSGGSSVKDVVAHLRAWQVVSIARLEAARLGGAPVYPGWADADPDADDALDEYNERIHETYRAQPWPETFRAWRDGFLRLLAVAEALPAADLLDTAKYPWLDGYALIEVLKGSCEHHREHLEDLA